MHPVATGPWEGKPLWEPSVDDSIKRNSLVSEKDRDPAKWIREFKLRRVLRASFLCLNQAPFRGGSLVVLHNGRWRLSPP